MDDQIYRQAAIDCLCNGKCTEEGRWCDDGDCMPVRRINSLPPAQSEINKPELIRTMNAGIIATDAKDVYSCGMRNGIRWCRALLEDDPPNFEDASQYAQPERKKGKWLCSDDLYETAVCSCCGWDTTESWQHIKSWFEFCPRCGADMRTR